MAISPFEPSESSLEKDAELFIQEEDDLGVALDLPTDERPSRPPIELKNSSFWPSLCFLKWQHRGSCHH